MPKRINKESRTLPTAHRTLPTKYVELHARSAFSFLRGAATPEELIAVCSELNMPAMALLDNDGVYGAARFHLAAQKVGIKAHIGAELTVQSPNEVQSPTSKVQGLKPEDNKGRKDVGHWTLDIGPWTLDF